MPALIDKLTREIEGQLDLFASMWPRYGDVADVEAPHRQRTAVNRLTGYAAFLGIAHRKSEGLEALRVWRKRVGPIRDIDVMREWAARAGVAGGERATAAAERLGATLLDRRTHLLEEVRRDTMGLPGAQARVGVEATRAEFRRALAELGAIDRKTALDTVLAPWRKRLAVLRGGHRDEELHAFRVANKRLRFVAEILVLEETAIIARVHTALGEMSDLWMLRDAIRIHRAAWALCGDAVACEDGAHLEAGRAALEAAPFAAWYALLPVVASGRFLSE